MTSNDRAPPESLMGQWAHTWSDLVFVPGERQPLVKYIATKAAQWGREQERAELPIGVIERVLYRLDLDRQELEDTLADDDTEEDRLLLRDCNNDIKQLRELTTKAKEVADVPV